MKSQRRSTMSKCRRSRELTPRDITAHLSILRMILLRNRHRRAEPSGIAPAAIVLAARPRHFPAIIEATEPLGTEIPHRLQFVGWH